MTKHAKGGDKGGNDKGGGKKGGGKGHGQKKQHNVVVNHHRVSEKVHKKEQDPVYFGVGAIREHVVLSENLSKKEKHVVEKLEAQIEYEEAHSHPEEAKKLLHRIEDINEKAGNKRHAAHNDPVKVIHSGGHRHRAHHHNQQTQEVA